MRFIDKLIANSKPFKDLEAGIEVRLDRILHEHRLILLDEYVKKVDKLVNLTERVHNTILSVKHNHESL